MSRQVRSKYNWPTIKQIYIIGKLNPETGESEDYTYTELAAMFNIKTDSAVKKRADKEGWNTEREGQKRKDEAIFKRKLEEMKAQELPTIIEMRRTVLKIQLGILKEGLAKLSAHEMDIKPGDLIKSSEFVINEYSTLFGTPQPKVATDDKAVELKVGNLDDLYNLADSIRRR